MNAEALIAAFEKKAAKHIPGAAKSVIFDVENVDFKGYLARKPEALREAIMFAAKSEYAAQISGKETNLALDLLIKSRLAHIQRVFVIDGLGAKGEGHKDKFLSTDEPEETYAALLRDIKTASKEVVRLARQKRWAKTRLK